MSFWKNVDLEREYKGLSRRELASLADFSLTSLSTGIIRGSIPAADVAYRIAKVLGVSIEYLLTGGGAPTREPDALDVVAERSRKYMKYRSMIEDFDALPERLRSSIEGMIHEIKAC